MESEALALEDCSSGPEGALSEALSSSIPSSTQPALSSSILSSTQSALSSSAVWLALFFSVWPALSSFAPAGTFLLRYLVGTLLLCPAGTLLLRCLIDTLLCLASILFLHLADTPLLPPARTLLRCLNGTSIWLSLPTGSLFPCLGGTLHDSVSILSPYLTAIGRGGWLE